jgi:hypothetical protein
LPWPPAVTGGERVEVALGVHLVRASAGAAAELLPQRARENRPREPAARSGGARRAIVLAGDQLAVPAQDRVGCDQPRELTQSATADDPALDSQASPLVIGEA